MLWNKNRFFIKLKTMKYIIFGLFIFSLPGYATTMCVHNGSYIVTLSISTNGVSSTTDGAGGWSVTFDYPTSSLGTNVVTGYAACNEVSGTANTVDSTVSTSTADVGENCWCSMATPMVSDWAYIDTYASNADCASGCATACANAIKTSSTLRSAIFQAIW